MSSIKPLPQDVAAQLKSSVKITSLNESVLGLIRNAIDACSTRVDVEVDYSRGSCSVEDDGEGISSSEFASEGGLGRPFHSSKYGSLETQHGCFGTFLASLGGVSILTIVSRRKGQKAKSQLVIYQASRLTSTTSDAAHQQLRSRNHGTRVDVQDLFGTMPVRVKQRPTGDENQRMRDRFWRELCNDCLALLLACDSDITLVMKGQDKGHSLSLQPASPSQRPPASQTDSFDAARCCHLLSLIPRTDKPALSSWVQTAARGDGIVLRGLISKQASPTKDMQFMSLGMYPLARDSAWACFYDTINSIFATSSFATGLSTTPKGKPSLKRTDSDAAKTESAYRQPMFCINVAYTCSGTSAPKRPSNLNSRDIATITDMLEAMVVGFLRNQGHRTKRRPRRRLNDQVNHTQGPLDPVSGNQDAFAGWSRMKGGSASRAEKTKASLPANDDTLWSDAEFSSFDETEAVALCKAVEPVTAPSGDQLVSWVNPKTGERLRINARTGMEENLLEEHSEAQTYSEPVRRKQRLTIAHGMQILADRGSEHRAVEDIVQAWRNPVFGQPEQSIPAAVRDEADLEKLVNLQQFGCDHSTSVDSAFKQQLKEIESRLTTEDLQQAKVVSQVDDKFILAVVQKNGNADLSSAEGNEQVVFIIDQHAADERIRVESLLRDLCCPATAEEQPLPSHSLRSRIETLRLDHAIVFPVQGREVDLFKVYEPYFASWGILYTLHHPATRQRSSKDQDRSGAQLVVFTLPPVIAERCRLDPALLRNVLFKEVWARDEAGAGSRSLAQASDGTTCTENSWLRRIHDCPRGLLDMVNSRSCRSAIMFNDKLTPEECQDLVDRLARCVFPFQCAHGRPSMLPLTNTSVLQRQEATGVNRDGFGEAYRHWK